MEDVAMSTPRCLRQAFAGRSVFVTGHTGFKGSWLTLWLASLGARVSGYALPPCTNPNLFELARVSDVLAQHDLADIRTLPALQAALHKAAPEVVFHLAAQPLVRQSYRDPVDTWSTNVMGTVNLMEAVRTCPSVKAVVVITTDKCYENREWLWGYREPDPLGGHDPYSASKAAAELVVQSYRKSFFAAGGPLVASARAGNVIGGGDFSTDRLIPDAVRAIAAQEPLMIRSPQATRPWQHVMESLHGYLLLAERLLAGQAAYAEPFNFGPESSDNLPVADVLARLQSHWPALVWQVDATATRAPHEARFLYLDSAKARQLLNWVPVWALEQGVARTAEWYKAFFEGSTDIAALTRRQIQIFQDEQ